MHLLELAWLQKVNYSPKEAQTGLRLGYREVLYFPLAVLEEVASPVSITQDNQILYVRQ